MLSGCRPRTPATEQSHAISHLAVALCRLGRLRRLHRSGGHRLPRLQGTGGRGGATPPGTFAITKCDVETDPTKALIEYTVVNSGTRHADYQLKFVVRDADGVQVGMVQRSLSLDASAMADEQTTVDLDAKVGRGAKQCALVLNG